MLKKKVHFVYEDARNAVVQSRDKTIRLKFIPTGDPIEKPIEKFNSIYIHQDVYQKRKEQFIQRLISLLGLNQKRIHGRKVTIQKIDRLTGKKFLNQHHLLGDGGGKIYLGLFSTNNLVGVAAFSKPLFMKHEEPSFYSTELIRFCTLIDTTVTGGLDKIIQYFFRNYKTDDIVTYVDREWSSGEAYTRIGFECIGKTAPLAFLISNGERVQVKVNSDNEKNANLVLNQGNLKFRLYRSK